MPCTCGGCTCQPSVTLTRVIQTCYACPSQWDAWDADGNYYYLRFRFGHGSITRSDSLDLMGNNEVIASFSSGDDMDGVISLEEFAAKAGITLAVE